MHDSILVSHHQDLWFLGTSLQEDKQLTHWVQRAAVLEALGGH